MACFFNEQLFFFLTAFWIVPSILGQVLFFLLLRPPAHAFLAAFSEVLSSRRALRLQARFCFSSLSQTTTFSPAIQLTGPDMLANTRTTVTTFIYQFLPKPSSSRSSQQLQNKPNETQETGVEHALSLGASRLPVSSVSRTSCFGGSASSQTSNPKSLQGFPFFFQGACSVVCGFSQSNLLLHTAQRE